MSADGEKREVEIKARTRGDWTRVYAEEEGRDISHLSYSPRRLRLGQESEVRMAGIGGVGTEPEYRRRGLAGRVFARAMDEIHGEGYSCAGLYTSTRIVAHRMYRRFGFVDVAGSPRAWKLLDPKRFVCDLLNAKLKDNGSSSVGDSLTVEITARPHEPVFVRVEERKARALDCPVTKVDVSVTLSDETLSALWQGHMTARYAEEANLLSWEGDEEALRAVLQLLTRRSHAVSGE